MNLNELMPQTIKFFVESIEFFTINSKLPMLTSKVFTEAKKNYLQWSSTWSPWWNICKGFTSFWLRFYNGGLCENIFGSIHINKEYICLQNNTTQLYLILGRAKFRTQAEHELARVCERVQRRCFLSPSNCLLSNVC